VYQEIANKAGAQNAELVGRLDRLQAKVDDLECALLERDRLIAEWQTGIMRLISQIESHEYQPVWRPARMPGKDEGK
jgi:hypothetical protein